MDKKNLVIEPHKHRFGDPTSPDLDPCDDLIGRGEDEAITLDQRFGPDWYGVIPASSATSKEQTPDLPPPDNATPLATRAINTVINELRSSRVQ